MLNTLQVRCHLEGLYAQYLKRLEILIANEAKSDSPPMMFASFKVLWGRWIDRYSQGDDSPEVWGESFLEHEFGPLV